MSDKRPNILLIFPDQHRGDWTELNENIPARTPNIKKMKENGVFFSKAYCPSPLCAPSRACLASGREYDNCNIINNKQPYPVDETTFYTLLRDSGYHTMACGKFDLNKPFSSFGNDGKQVINGVSYLDLWGFSDGIDNGGKHDGVRTFRNKEKEMGPYLKYLDDKGLAKKHVRDFIFKNNYTRWLCTPLSDEDYADNWIGRNGLNLIRSAPEDKPWFLQVNFNGPHEPMDVTRTMRQRWKDVEFPEPSKCTRFNDRQAQRMRQNYSAMVENIDRWIGIYINELKERDEFDNTIIVYSSDHGEMLGDHNLKAKRQPYDESSRVPLAISGPGIKHWGIIDDPVETLDLSATFLDYARIPTPNYMNSQSIKDFLEGNQDLSRRHARSGFASWRMVFDGQYKLVAGYYTSNMKSNQKFKKKEILEAPFHLFNLRNDPNENEDIAESNQDIVQRLRKLLVIS
ncbi:MAG: sulfatase-like hydrolase/transferase [Candidatus Lokiarchaeota archaeon]|nr:sulfatase-like hydrolase/transferase [Candidatus Lokiarchaeota archaeon]